MASEGALPQMTPTTPPGGAQASTAPGHRHAENNAGVDESGPSIEPAADDESSRPSSPNPAPSSADASEELPSWLSNALAYLRSVADVAEWEEICALLVQHEIRLKFPDGSAVANRLPTNKRPGEIRWWQGRGRAYNNLPLITDDARYGESWKAWWEALQPSWRKFSWPPAQSIADNGADDGAEDWGVLDRGGCNGIFLAVVSLGWWWAAVGAKRGDAAEVRVAMKDVAWALKRMQQGLGKRPAEQTSTSPAKRRRRK